jgi:hypothetical protein
MRGIREELTRWFAEHETGTIADTLLTDNNPVSDSSGVN